MDTGSEAPCGQRRRNEGGKKKERERERERGTRPPSTTHLLFSRSKLFPPFRVAREVEKAFESRTPDGWRSGAFYSNNRDERTHPCITRRNGAPASNAASQDMAIGSIYAYRSKYVCYSYLFFIDSFSFFKFLVHRWCMIDILNWHGDLDDSILYTVKYVSILFLFFLYKFDDLFLIFDIFVSSRLLFPSWFNLLITRQISLN